MVQNVACNDATSNQINCAMLDKSPFYHRDDSTNVPLILLHTFCMVMSAYLAGKGENYCAGASSQG